MNNPINKDTLAKLRKRNQSNSIKSEPEDIPKASKVKGFDVGRNNSGATRRKNFMLDESTIDGLDDLSYQLKKRIGRRVSLSELVRAGYRVFSALPQDEQIHHLDG